MDEAVEGAAAADGAPGHEAVAEVPIAPSTSKRRRKFWMPFSVVLIALAGAGAVAWHQVVAPVVSSRKYRQVTYAVPTAPQLSAEHGETIYRIDPTRSSLSYSLHEKFVGRSTSTATGVTNGLAGDVALDPTHGSSARVGEIVANLEQLHSNNNLRDARLRQDFLESHAYPLAHFTVTKLSGLPDHVVQGRSYPFTMTGRATIKQVTAPITWTGTAELKDGRILASATAPVKLSTFKVGPISLAGLVTTSDDAKLSLKLTVSDPSQHVIPTRITGPHAKTTPGGPSFKADVAPIIEQSCAACHNSGQIGAERWTLDKAGDAAAISDGIKTVTQTGYMPPSPASNIGVPLVRPLSLSKAQIATLAAWADHGGKLDEPADTPINPTTQIKTLMPRKDVTLRDPAYTGSLKNKNDYRCFLLTPKITKPMYLTGYSFLADQVPEIHHVQVFHVSAQQAANAPAVEGQDGKAGWECYGGPGLRGPKPPAVPGRYFHQDAGFAGQADLVAGWVPGQLPAIYPDHSGILMEPGDALVMQIHFHYSTTPTPDRSGLALQLDPVSKKLKAVRIVNPLAPVEIPCAKGAKEKLCNRDAAIAELTKQFGPDGANNEAGLLELCGETPADLTKDFNGVVAHSHCMTKVPENGLIVAVLGHMHTLGKSIRMTLNPGQPDQKILLDIPVWKFGWQMNYQLATPLHVTAGEPIELQCSWDRSIDPTRPQKYIVFAEGTEDEMCFGTYALIPDDQKPSKLPPGFDINTYGRHRFGGGMPPSGSRPAG